MELEGEEHLVRACAGGARVLFFSGHFGNWEMILPTAAQLGTPVAELYRADSKAGVNGAAGHATAGDGQTCRCSRRDDGARAAMLHMKRGSSLVDQKMNDGITVPFFGRVAMTASAIA